MGHTQQQRQGIRSTKQKQELSDAPPPQQPDSRTDISEKNTIITSVNELTHTVFSDQTGRLPSKSRAGNQYIMILFHVDSNYTFAEPMKNRSDDKMQRAYLIVLNQMKAAGLTVNKHILDNECSAAMNQLISKTCPYELVPPHCHRRNRAEVTIKAFKQHVISVFAGLDPTFPMSQWDKLIPHIELTLNLLKQSKAKPQLSAYEHMHGPYNYTTDTR